MSGTEYTLVLERMGNPGFGCPTQPCFWIVWDSSHRPPASVTDIDTVHRYSARVTKGLTRSYGNNDLHFITFSCYARWVAHPELLHIQAIFTGCRIPASFAGVGVFVYTATFRRAVLVTEVLCLSERAAIGAASRRLKCRRLPIIVAAREIVSSDTGV